MGRLIYGSGEEFDIDDRTLAHLKVAIGEKLRKQESFFVSWENAPDDGGGRQSIWVSPAIPLVFKFLGSRRPQLNPAWVDALCGLSHTPRGLVLLSEQDAQKWTPDISSEDIHATPTLAAPTDTHVA